MTHLMAMTSVPMLLHQVFNLLQPPSFAATASAQSQLQPAGNQPTPAAQILAQLEQDAAFNKGLTEGFLTEFCETFNLAQLLTVGQDFYECIRTIIGDIQNHTAWRTIFEKRVHPPLSQLYLMLTHIGQKQVEPEGKEKWVALSSEEWGQLVGPLLFHIVLTIILSVVPVGEVAEAGLIATRLGTAVHVAQTVRGFSGAHDPKNPCAGPLVGMLAEGVGAATEVGAVAAGKAFKGVLARAAEKVAQGADEAYAEAAGKVAAPEEIAVREGTLSDQVPTVTTEEWIPEKGLRLPKDGRWEDQRGNSTFFPNDPEKYGLKSGEGIPFRRGRPDFSQWSRGSFVSDEPLLGDKSDFLKMYRTIALAKAAAEPDYRWNVTKVREWLQRERLTPHHTSGNEFQLIPWELHSNPSANPPVRGIRHTGGAYDLRNQ
jgi:hypothetical protein